MRMVEARKTRQCACILAFADQLGGFVHDFAIGGVEQGEGARQAVEVQVHGRRGRRSQRQTGRADEKSSNHTQTGHSLDAQYTAEDAGLDLPQQPDRTVCQPGAEERAGDHVTQEMHPQENPPECDAAGAKQQPD